MGIVTSKIENNKIIGMTRTGMGIQGSQTLDNNPVLQKYKDFVNNNGMIIVKVNVQTLHDVALKLYKRLDFSKITSEMKKLSDYDAFVNDFEKKISINSTPPGQGIGMGILMIGLYSTFGLFSIVEDGLMKNINKPETKSESKSESKPETTYDFSDPYLHLLVPKILFKNNNTDFINFLVTDFNNLGNNPDKNLLLQLFQILLDKINKNSSNSEVKIANLINILFNLVIIFGLQTYFLPFDRQNVSIIISEYLGDLIGSLPDNKCYFNSNNIITFNPDICNITKNESAQCPPPPTCPEKVVCDTSLGVTNNYLMIGCGILGFLVIILFILYIRKNVQVQVQREVE